MRDYKGWKITTEERIVDRKRWYVAYCRREVGAATWCYAVSSQDGYADLALRCTNTIDTLDARVYKTPEVF